jgi:hypothetical protein
MTLQAPFPYFGGKSKIAPLVWEAFGPIENYVEPFLGSAAVLLARPDFDPKAPPTETVNDIDGFIANFWRSLQADPEAVAWWADWPVSEIDLHARHGWLINRRERLRWSLEDPDFYDAKIAGWWVWGLSSWIGAGWCSGQGPWVSNGAHVEDSRQAPERNGEGSGMKRQLPHLLGGRGVQRKNTDLADYFGTLALRLRRVRVCNGDWSRVLGPSPTVQHGLTGVFLDPPYADTAGRAADLYAHDSLQVAHAVREWAIANGDDPRFRIVLAGYEGEHAMPESWTVSAWNAGEGYGSQKQGERSGNGKRERLWFSPHCLSQRQAMLFA